jgi:DNA-binding LacI/PurR family transcriptional regulator
MARPTLDDVATRAGVSRQTVSNVLNAPHVVRPETRGRVEVVIAELGYRPNQAARTLKTRRSRLLGARIESPRDGINGVVHNRFLHALTSQAQAQGYRVMLFSAARDEEEIEQYAHLLEDQDLDAFVLIGTHVGDARTAWLAEREVPFVTFGRPWGSLAAHHSWVDVDGSAGTRAATEHLIEIGHRRIAFLGWHQDAGVGDDRRAGWWQACHAAGLPTDGLDLNLLEGVDQGQSATSTLLERADPPTALVCVSDSIALGAWTELARRGLRPGQDVAIVGFDDSPTAEVIGLSSAAQPLDQVATTCLSLLHTVLDATAPAAGPPGPVLLEPRLMVRASSARD